jgi:hypothetical protein
MWLGIYYASSGSRVCTTLTHNARSANVVEFRADGRFKPANVSLGSTVGRRTQGSMDRPSFFFFSFELSYQRERRSPVWTGSLGLLVSSRKNLLQRPPSLCRMVVCRLD